MSDQDFLISLEQFLGADNTYRGWRISCLWNVIRNIVWSGLYHGEDFLTSTIANSTNEKPF